MLAYQRILRFSPNWRSTCPRATGSHKKFGAHAVVFADPVRIPAKQAEALWLITLQLPDFEFSIEIAEFVFLHPCHVNVIKLQFPRSELLRMGLMFWSRPLLLPWQNQSISGDLGTRRDGVRLMMLTCSTLEDHRTRPSSTVRAAHFV